MFFLTGSRGWIPLNTPLFPTSSSIKFYNLRLGILINSKTLGLYMANAMIYNQFPKSTPLPFSRKLSPAHIAAIKIWTCVNSSVT